MNTEQLEIEQVSELKPAKSKASNVLVIIGNVIKWIILAILVLIVIGNVVCIYKMRVKNEQVPTFLGFASVEVIGNSMHPTLEIGDIIIIFKSGNYKVGDIVTFVDSVGVVVTHRVIEVREDGTYATAGDYTGSEDPQFLTNNDIVGKVILTLSGFGNVVRFFQSIWGILILIAIGFLIIELPYIISAISESVEKRKLKKQIEKKEAEQSGIVAGEDASVKENVSREEQKEIENANAKDASEGEQNWQATESASTKNESEREQNWQATESASTKNESEGEQNRQVAESADSQDKKEISSVKNNGEQTKDQQATQNSGTKNKSGREQDLVATENVVAGNALTESEEEVNVATNNEKGDVKKKPLKVGQANKTNKKTGQKKKKISVQKKN